MYSISIFYFTFYLFGGAYAPNAPLAYEPGNIIGRVRPFISNLAVKLTDL